MKTHIFIATTQGLVAIQNITPIDDDDISSVVSVNGTSTTANISSSYHNFVKKGVGIIHQMFGACSYRVDISARIDQGNSWQVAMYLAHLAQSKGLLGNGEINKGDTVICATGEVNTTNQQVLAVGEVPLKLKLAQPQLEQWAALGAQVHFIIPQANQNEVTKSPYIMLVSNLEQAASALPNAPNKQPKKIVKKKKSVSINTQYTLVILIVLLVSVVFFALNQYSPNKIKKHQPLYKTTKLSQAELDKSIQLVALLKQGKTCARTSSKSVNLSKQIFAEVALSQLCELYLQTNTSTVQILLVAQDAYTVLPLKQNQLSWQIPLPKNRLSDRSYFLVTLIQTLSEEKIEQLRLYRETMPKPDMLSEKALTDWLDKQEVDFTVYTHKLVVE